MSFHGRHFKTKNKIFQLIRHECTISLVGQRQGTEDDECNCFQSLIHCFFYISYHSGRRSVWARWVKRDFMKLTELMSLWMTVRIHVGTVYRPLKYKEHFGLDTQALGSSSSPWKGEWWSKLTFKLQFIFIRSSWKWKIITSTYMDMWNSSHTTELNTPWLLLSLRIISSVNR